MEPIALQVKPPSFDAFGAMKQGAELANLGLQPLRIAQELRQAQIAERQMLIAEQEAQRNLDFKRFEDETNRVFGEIVRQHTSKGPDGRTVIDYEQALQSALRDPRVEPSRLASIQEKVLDARAKSVKTVTDFNQTLDKFKVDTARAIRGMDEQQAARYVDANTKLFMRSFSEVPPELVQENIASFFGVKQGASLVKNAQAVIKAIDINEQQELANKFTETGLAQAAETIRQAGQQTMTSPEASNAGSNVSRAAQQVLLASLGPNATDAERNQIRTMSAANIANMPGVRELLQANVQPAATRASQQVAAVDADIKSNFFGKLEASAIKVARGKFAPELTPANIISNKFNQALMDNPDVREYVTLIQEANAKGIPIPEDAAGPSSVAQIARGQQQLLRREAEARRNQSASARFNNPAPADGVLLRRKSDGKVATRRISEAEARDRLSSGKYERVK